MRKRLFWPLYLFLILMPAVRMGGVEKRPSQGVLLEVEAPQYADVLKVVKVVVSVRNTMSKRVPSFELIYTLNDEAAVSRQITEVLEVNETRKLVLSVNGLLVGENMLKVCVLLEDGGKKKRVDQECVIMGRKMRGASQDEDDYIIEYLTHK